jgi:hypothetical protein
MLSPAVLQFGTGRFQLAHVDLFVSEAHAPPKCAVRQLLSTGGGVLEHRHGRPGADLDRVGQDKDV